MVLDRVNQMKQQGMDEGAIISSLQQQGVSPRQINDAMAQSNVKAAVADETQSSPPQAPQSTQEIGGGIGGMQPSIMGGGASPEAPVPGAGEEMYSKQEMPQAPTQEQYAGEQTYQEYEEPGYVGEQYGGGGEYQDYGAGEAYSSTSTDAIGEIAEQIIQEKFNKTNKTIENLKEIKTLLSAQVEKIDERLKRVESIIDQLQTSLMRRSTEQMQDLEDIKGEMKGMQQGFSKIINPLVEEAREAEEKLSHRSPRRKATTKRKTHTKKATKKKATKKRTTRKKKDDLDDFLKF